MTTETPPPQELAEKYSHLVKTVYGYTHQMNQCLEALRSNTIQLQEDVRELIAEMEHLKPPTEDSQ